MENLQDTNKPVAWIEHHKGGDNLVWDDPSGERTPLYTTPQQRTWQSLTDEEIVLISAECAASHQHTDIHFARAIEAKLRSKNYDS